MRLATENRCWAIRAEVAGWNGTLTGLGCSEIVDPYGNIVGEAQLGRPDLASGRHRRLRFTRRRARLLRSGPRYPEWQSFRAELLGNLARGQLGFHLALARPNHSGDRTAHQSPTTCPVWAQPSE